MKGKFKWWWSSFPPISTNRINTSHNNLHNIHKKITTYGVLIPGSGLEQTQTYGVVKPVNMNASGNMNAFYISCFFFIFFTTFFFHEISGKKIISIKV